MVATPTYTIIQETTLASAVSSITLPIPGGYKDIVIIISAIPTSNAVTGLLQINGDSGTNYTMVGMRGNGTNTACYSTSLGYGFFDYAGDTLVSTTTVSTLQFIDYSSTNKHKTFLVRNSNAGDVVEAMAQKWASTSAISSIQFYWSAGNIAAGSVFSIRGIEG